MEIKFKLLLYGVHRAIGDTHKRKGVSSSSILDALKNPVKVKEVKVKNQEKSQKFDGKTSSVVINPDTGKIISVNPKSYKK